jgi:hypothetical protein
VVLVQKSNLFRLRHKCRSPLESICNEVGPFQQRGIVTERRRVRPVAHLRLVGSLPNFRAVDQPSHCVSLTLQQQVVVRRESVVVLSRFAYRRFDHRPNLAGLRRTCTAPASSMFGGGFVDVRNSRPLAQWHGARRSTSFPP